MDQQRFKVPKKEVTSFKDAENEITENKKGTKITLT